MRCDYASHALAGVIPSLRRVPAHTYLFRQGDTPFAMFKLLSGQLTLVRVTPDGSEVPMHTVRAGEFFAEASLFSDRYHCDAIARQDCEVLVYPKQSLAQQLRHSPEALWIFTEELAHRIQEVRSRLQARQIRSAKERVLHVLKLKCGEKRSWEMDITLKQLAEEIGLTHEALYRALAVLDEEGSILRSKGRIKLM